MIDYPIILVFSSEMDKVRYMRFLMIQNQYQPELVVMPDVVIVRVKDNE